MTVATKVVTRYLVSGDFVRRVQESKTKNQNAAKLRVGWFNIFSPELAERSVPLADNRMFITTERKVVACQYVNAMEDMRTPQMGTPNKEYQEWVFSTDALSTDDMAYTMEQHKGEIREMMINSLTQAS
jgi:hypothetical protein